LQVPPCGQPGLRNAWQVPATHAAPDGHAPQLPPQPSSPHTLPGQAGMHAETQVPATQTCEDAHAPQVPPQPSSPHDLDAHAGTQVGGAPTPTCAGAPPPQAVIAARRRSTPGMPLRRMTAPVASAVPGLPPGTAGSSERSRPAEPPTRQDCRPIASRSQIVPTIEEARACHVIECEQFDDFGVSRK
jgi:hypothetical protein